MEYAYKQENRVRAGEAREGQTTAYIEGFTSKVPSGFFLGAAIVSIAGSLVLKSFKKDRDALFVGQWVAPFLVLGLYNKLVKQHGSDAETRQPDFGSSSFEHVA